MSFSSGFGLIATTGGLASPLAIAAAAAAIAGRQHAGAVLPQPSTGGFITFAGTTFGGTSAVSAALTATGYITAMSAVA